MGLLTKLATLLSSDKVRYDYVNDLVDDLYDIIGTTINGRGSLTWENLSATAEIVPTQVADTAVVRGNTVSPGEQVIVRPTDIEKLTSLGMDISSEIASEVAVASGGVTMAIAEPTKFVQRFQTPSTIVADALVATITGGTVNKCYIILITNNDATSVFRLIHTDANAANNIKLKAISDAANAEGNHKIFAQTTGTDGWRTIAGLFFYGDLNSSGFNQWWQIG